MHVVFVQFFDHSLLLSGWFSFSVSPWYGKVSSSLQAFPMTFLPNFLIQTMSCLKGSYGGIMEDAVSTFGVLTFSMVTFLLM